MYSRPPVKIPVKLLPDGPAPPNVWAPMMATASLGLIPNSSRKKPMVWELLKWASGRFRIALLSGEVGQSGRQYLKQNFG